MTISHQCLCLLIMLHRLKTAVSHKPNNQFHQQLSTQLNNNFFRTFTLCLFTIVLSYDSIYLLTLLLLLR